MRLVHNKGIKGENEACQYLVKNNWYIIERNWHCYLGEIDIIAKKEGWLVFFEVKFRTNKTFGSVLESITSQKLSKIKKSVLFYLQTHPTEHAIRVDALLIDNNPFRIHHIFNIIDC